MEQAIFMKKEQHHFSSELYFAFCGFSKTLPFHAFGPTVRNSYIIHVVLAGKGKYYVKDEKYSLKKGNIFLIRPGESTFYRSDAEEPWLYAWISFGGKVADEIIHYSSFKEGTYSVTSTNIQQYLDIILECMNCSNDTLEGELKLNELTYRFLRLLLTDGGEFLTGVKQKFSRLAIEAMTYIGNHYLEEITVRDVANHLAVNRSHLSRVFQNHFGMSMKGWILRVRINHATYLLSMTNESVENISYQVGFRSLVVFSRIFKKLIGETPTHYRKRMSKENSQTISLSSLKFLLDEQEIISRAT
ncbi:AraC family transcriptional regulator [Bacillus toyonensis]|uniref:AraC family transcriptional regulator n=1 Tax=Bacillus toyonensis TaxID=155322 RepID=UPI000BF19747|nr:AraC family transcriptional regulator [Bacillus toyonensis]PEK90924.1 AraC family transcriptional regulator [Bacillus toyonensis]PFY40299.1 AraC family transcriptional regulator [Bacillus toyonensis]PFY42713.1 AraC family transcriptional regulator [Bacillus toyonensis]PFY54503.1 AraC family transcriptional regulator [Bacillus toyonensis]PFY63235.1 AraC family transcriptional regulator [Bacillus toyonensis]